MDFFINDSKKFYIYKNNNYLKFNFVSNNHLIINNIFFIENFQIERFLNNLCLLEKLIGLKFYKLKFNYKNLFFKNRYLTLLTQIQYKMSNKYIYPILNYLIVHTYVNNFLINLFVSKRNFLTLNNHKQNFNNNFIFLNLKLVYDYFSFTNKKNYLKSKQVEYFDNKIWLYFYLFINNNYIKKDFFNLLEDIKLIWNNFL